ncbi:GNAT family N-acetyltransferase [Phytomonospora sp. NPDC050363]|uniref:GNAT family N-acetyltransferase n=1 Tax=Phytomonospora sp. NPDC050363 TaxID=3155642 RepID=UPI0034074024
MDDLPLSDQPDITELTTARLRLRQWRREDYAPFAELNADPEVMEHFPSTLTRERSDALATRIAGAINDNGFGLWAVELTETGEFLGFTGLSTATFDAHFTPAVEIGWRLARKAWGHGYATEAATAALDHAFGFLRLAEVVSFTAVGNVRSQAVMTRLGLTKDPHGDFHHPSVGDHTNRVSLHVLYRISASQWAQRD